MPWEYAKAIRRDNTVTVTVQNADDPEDVQVKEWTWTKDPDQTWVRFRDMVKAEVRALLTYLNYVPVEEDVTREFEKVPR